MEIHHLLFVSELNQELEKLLAPYQIEKDIRFKKEEDIQSSDLQWADAFVSFKTKKSYDYGKVKWVHSLGAGVDHFLFQKDWDENVLLTRTICSFGERISEYCLSFLLKDLQFHDRFTEHQSEKCWQPIKPRMLKESKIVIYGTGEIGQKLAVVLSSFGVEVYGVSLSGKQKAGFKQVFKTEDHCMMLKSVDYMINTLPLTKKTEQLFNDRIFSNLSQAGFINVGRGESVAESDLLTALDTEQLRFAVLDVFANEPMPAEHPFWKEPRITITPHISAVTTAEEAVQCFVETLERVENDRPLQNQVDIEKGF
ncbi:D-2-hydroxyacid dehydrogenase [Gracilibacillus caseinilyticus]|uniref:D-2-hydroxyacid dehydrogenase n=1 Tax=Gracilibacillus caseinilyticus TaxID=2932256 RepID=A0ABY4EWL5_9BACI|nr:D-2-hydroxyacid dehydrogenase [Gracilibacillus caseinilyticus]UOQ48660.1 D-2-hydroxyacid dehydrogenase [Gracilibacillus caseinilyticus]